MKQKRKGAADEKTDLNSHDMRNRYVCYCGITFNRGIREKEKED